jgi:hypothetical protein
MMELQVGRKIARLAIAEGGANWDFIEAIGVLDDIAKGDDRAYRSGVLALVGYCPIRQAPIALDLMMLGLEHTDAATFRQKAREYMQSVNAPKP